MKYAARFFAMVLMMAPLLASAQLTRGHTLAANVPFQFRAGEKVVPCSEQEGALVRSRFPTGLAR